MCRHHVRIGGGGGGMALLTNGASPVPAIVFGAAGLMAVQFTGNGLDEPILGSHTGTLYSFHERPTIYVDRRDAVFILSNEFIEVEL